MASVHEESPGCHIVPFSKDRAEWGYDQAVQHCEECFWRYFVAANKNKQSLLRGTQIMSNTETMSCDNCWRKILKPRPSLLMPSKRGCKSGRQEKARRAAALASGNAASGTSTAAPASEFNILNQNLGGLSMFLLFLSGVSSASTLVFGGVVGDFWRILPLDLSPSDIHHHFGSICFNPAKPIPRVGLRFPVFRVGFLA